MRPPRAGDPGPRRRLPDRRYPADLAAGPQHHPAQHRPPPVRVTPAAGSRARGPPRVSVRPRFRGRPVRRHSREDLRRGILGRVDPVPFGGEPVAGEVLAPIGGIAGHVDGTRQHGHVHPPRPDGAAELIDHDRLLEGRDAAAEVDECDPGVREVPLGSVASQIAIGHAQRGADLQERPVLEGFIGGP